MKRPCIGDTESFACSDPYALAQANWRKRQTARALTMARPTNQGHLAALKAVRDGEARTWRMSDPLEQAKTFLRRRGAANVHAGRVIGLPKGCTVADGVIFDDADLIRHVELLEAGKSGLRPDQSKWSQWTRTKVRHGPINTDSHCHKGD